MRLDGSYDGLSVQDVLNMSEDELREMLLRLIRLETVDSSQYLPTQMYLPDDVADVLRGRDLDRLL